MVSAWPLPHSPQRTPKTQATPASTSTSEPVCMLVAFAAASALTRDRPCTTANGADGSGGPLPHAEDAGAVAPLVTSVLVGKRNAGAGAGRASWCRCCHGGERALEGSKVGPGKGHPNDRSDEHCTHTNKKGLVWCFHACASTCRWLASEWKHADTRFQIALLVPTGCGCF